MSQYTYAPDPPESTLNADITNSATSMEVDTIPNGVSAGDEVKCILQQNHPHELVIGEVQTIGNGANGGTDISGLERGAEGTSAASHTSGDVVIVGAGGRDEMAVRHPPWDPSVLPGYLNVIGTETNSSRSNFGGRIHFVPIIIPQTFTISEVNIDIQSAGTESSAGSGIVRIVCYTINVLGEPKDKQATWDVDGTTTGVKTATANLTLEPGMYDFGVWEDGWSTQPEWRLVQDIMIPAYGNKRNFNKDWRRTDNEYTDPLPSNLEGEPLATDSGPVISLA